MLDPQRTSHRKYGLTSPPWSFDARRKNLSLHATGEARGGIAQPVMQRLVTLRGLDWRLGQSACGD